MAGEKNFEVRLKNWLQSQGIYPLGTPKHRMTMTPMGYYEKRFGSAYTVNGLPDLHVSVKGIDVELELKAPDGRASELQKFVIKQMRDAGVMAYIVYEEAKDVPDDNIYTCFAGVKILITELLKVSEQCKYGNK